MRHGTTLVARQTKARLRGRTAATRGARSAAGRFGAILRGLHRAYSEADLGNLSDPIDELVYISLTRQTHRQNAMRSWNRVTAVGGPRALLRMPVRNIVKLLNDAGFAEQKARWIKRSLQIVVDRMGELSLRPAEGWSDEELERFLCSLPGVRIKTAKCIMLYSMGRKVLPVDTHARRIAERLGLVPTGLSERRVHEGLESIVPPADRHAFHVNAIWHGRAVCTALRPRCDLCMIRQHCDFGRRHRPAAPRQGIEA